MNDVLEERMKEAYRLARCETDETATSEFAFHIDDCAEDLLRYAEVLKSPSSYTPEQIKEVLNDVLCHAVGHLVRAARLYGGFIDPFGTKGTVDDQSSDTSTG